MRDSRFRRRHAGSPSSMAAWMSLLFIIVALVVVLLTRDQLGKAAASCYTDMSAVQPAGTGQAEDVTELPAPNIMVRPPDVIPAKQ